MDVALLSVLRDGLLRRSEVAALTWGDVELLDRLTHHVHILEMNGESYRLKRSGENAAAQAPEKPEDA